MSGEMNFELVKSALTTTLGAQAAARFVVQGYEARNHAAEDFLANRHVEVHFSNSQFDKSKSGWTSGPFHHGLRFTIGLSVAADARADLTVLSDPDAEAVALASALAASLEAGARADALWDELARIVWGILMLPANMQLGMTSPVVQSRFVDSIAKNPVQPRGKYVILSGSLEYSCSVVEYPATVTPTPAGAGAVDTTITQTADPTGATTDTAKQGAQAP